MDKIHPDDILDFQQYFPQSYESIANLSRNALIKIQTAPTKKEIMKNKKQWQKPVMKQIVISMESTAYSATV